MSASTKPRSSRSQLTAGERSQRSNMNRRAAFSRCGTYSSRLDRDWSNSRESLGSVVFIGLNPSTADHRVDDPTIRRCIDFTRRWGYDALTVVNLFAYRTPYPKILKQADDPVGPYNIRHIKNAVKTADLTVACWGRYGSWFNQDQRLFGQLGTKLYCFSQNADGSPAHPLYQRADTKPKLWQV